MSSIGDRPCCLCLELPPTIKKRSCGSHLESGAGTVEYVIVVLVAIVIGSGLLAFGNQVSGQVTKTGNSISSWFSKANGTGGTGGGNTGGGNSGTDSRIDELKEKAAIGRDGSKQLEAVRNREGLENFDGRDFR